MPPPVAHNGAMRFEHTTTYPASAEAVLAMLTDESFRRRVCEQQHALSYAVRVLGTGVGAEVTITQTQSMKGAPAIASKLTGDSVELTQRESWRSARAADFSFEIPGKPGDLRGTIALQDSPGADGSCEEVFTGEVKVRVPLVGGRLESLIADILRAALRREGETGQTWLAG